MSDSTETTKAVKMDMKENVAKLASDATITETSDTIVKDLVTGRALDYKNEDDAVLIELNRVMSIAFGLTSDALAKLSGANIRAIELLWKMKLPEINTLMANSFEFVRGYIDYKRESTNVTPDDVENLVEDATENVDSTITSDDVEAIVENASTELSEEA